MNNALKIIGITGALLLTSCTSEKDVAKYAEMEGWDSYEVIGYSFFGCDEKDAFHTEFKAIKNKREFTGIICSGLFKGATLRLN
jgi:hypothetical protein